MSDEIYALLDDDRSIRYIGKARDAQARFKSHMRDARRRDTPVYRWIRKRADQGRKITVEVLAVTDDWRREERGAIAYARAAGCRLLNVADGGDEPHCPLHVRQENARKNSAAVHGMFADPQRQRIWALKRTIGGLIAAGRLTEPQKEKLRYAARKAPHIFGSYANL